jgi:hypothetical protein
VDGEAWATKLDRVGRALWELLHSHAELDHVRAEVILEPGGERQVLSTDVAGGVLWIDEHGDDHRQVVLPDGRLARADQRIVTAEVCGGFVSPPAESCDR